MATGKGEQESGGKPRIVHLDKVTMGGFEIPRPDTPHVWIEYDFTEPDAVVSRLAGADIAILNKVRQRCDRPGRGEPGAGARYGSGVRRTAGAACR